jgi:hypothetical protein
MTKSATLPGEFCHYQGCSQLFGLRMHLCAEPYMVDHRIEYGHFVSGVEVDIDFGKDGTVDLAKRWMP